MAEYQQRFRANKELQLRGETRWWSEEATLGYIFGSFIEPDKSFSADLIKVLNAIEKTPDVRATAVGYKADLLKFEHVLIA